MKLKMEYSWPLRDKSVCKQVSYPYVNRDNIINIIDEFLADALRFANNDSFKLSVSLEHD